MDLRPAWSHDVSFDYSILPGKVYDGSVGILLIIRQVVRSVEA